MEDDLDYTALVAAAGAEHVGRTWAANLRASLDRAYAAGPDAPYELSEWGWEEDALTWGGNGVPTIPPSDLDPDVRYELIVQAARAAQGDEDLLWCLGDMPADHLVGDDAQQGERLHRARAEHPEVEHMFQVMQRYLRRHSHPMGWWADGWTNT